MIYWDESLFKLSETISRVKYIQYEASYNKEAS
jgi:hypothetical protein